MGKSKEVMWRGKKYSSITELALEKGISKSTASRWIKEDRVDRSNEVVINGEVYKKSYIESLAKKHDLTISVVKSRLRHGKPVGSKTSARKHKFQGKMRTLHEISDLTGIPYQTLVNRRQKGIPLDAPKARVKKAEKKHLHNGKKYTARELAEMYNIPLRVMRARLQQGTAVDKPYVPKKKSV